MGAVLAPARAINLKPMSVGVVEIFNACKNGEKSILASRAKLVNLLSVKDQAEFQEELKKCICVILLKATKNKDMLRGAELLASFVTSSDILHLRCPESVDESNVEIEAIFYFVIQLVLSYSCASCRFVRLQTCALLSRIIDLLPRDIRLDVSLLDEISEKLCACLKDTSPYVRAKAIQALSRIQDPEDEGCQITNDYLQLLEFDVNPAVRLSAATYLCITNKSLPALLRRVYDVRPAVRQIIYSRLTKSVPVKALKIDQRVKLITAGLSEKSPETKLAFKRLLVDEWFSGVCKISLTAFVSLFDVEEDREFLHRTLGYIFDNIVVEQFEECVKFIRPWLDEFNTLSGNFLANSECVLIWHAILKHILTGPSNLQAIYGSLVPELLHLSRLIDRHMAEKPQPYVLFELFSLLRCFDLSDEAGRKAVLDSLSRALSKPQQAGLTCIPELVRSYMHFSANPTRALDAIVEFISEVRQPIISLPVSSQENGFKNLDATSNENNVGTQTPTSESPEVLLTCLSIIAETIQARNVELGSPNAVSLLHSFILPLVQDEREDVRAEAVRCLALFCICMKDLATKFVVLLVHVINLDTLEIKNIAISALLDILTLYGFSVLPEDPENLSSANVVDFLLELAEKESHAETLLILISGIAKLFLFKRISCERALSFLMLCYLNQSLQKERRMRLVLSQFFSAFHNKRFSDLSDTVVKACALTLKEAASEENSVLVPHLVNLVSNVTAFYPGTSVSEVLESPSLRERLVLVLLEELSQSDDDDALKKLDLKVLSSFSFLINTESGLAEAQRLLEKLTAHFKESGGDTRALRALSKLDDRLCLRDMSSLINKTQLETTTVD